MEKQYLDYWTEVLRWLITTLVFGFYIALTFFSFRGDWDFLFTFEYWLTTLSSTSIAWFLRWLWSHKGMENRLFNSQDVKDKQLGKEKLIAEINSNNLTDLLEVAIDNANHNEKLKQYKNKCERKIRKYQGKKFAKRRLNYWKQERINCDNEDFNLDIRKVRYYKFDIDSMLSSTYKSTNEVETRGNLNNVVLKSYRTNMVTMLAFAILGALQVFLKDYTNEDLFILLGRILIFTLNIYSGFNLGKSFIDMNYSRDLSKDYVFMKTFIKKNNIKRTN